MEFLAELGQFAGKSLFVFLIIAGVMILLAALVMKAKQARESLEVESLNEKFEAFAEALKPIISDEKTLKADLKAKKKLEKKERKLGVQKPHIFVIDFTGDLRGHQVDSLRDEVSAVLAVARPGVDQVLIRLESGGGMVHAYGLGASQLLRLRQAQIHLTVSVDKIAASGGYMMACTADQIIAAPFAILGSIGVIAQVPNLHRLLKKHDVDYDEITAGEFKRTISLLAEITPKGKQKFLEQIEDTHLLFKEFVQANRPQLDLDKVATGEYWFGERAKSLQLADELMTSDEYLYKAKDRAQILKIKVIQKRKLSEKLSEAMSASADRLLLKWWQRLYESRFTGSI